jgi:hypothetical protein
MKASTGNEVRASLKRRNPMCPICLSLVAKNEIDLISHMLADHPSEARGLGLALALANLGLARRPGLLLRIDIAILAIAVILARNNRHGWGNS